MIFPFFTKKTAIVSKLNGVISIGSSYRQKTLFADGIPQSGGEFVYMWNILLKGIHQEGLKISKALVMGLAGGTVIKSIQKYYPEIELVCVEIDPIMVELAEKYFQIKNEDKIKIVVSDACKWIDKNYQKYIFDLLVIDLFYKDINPSCSRTVKFLRNLEKTKSEGGKILYNCHYQSGNKTEYDRFLHQCQSIFSSVEEVFSYQKNRVLMLRQ